MSPGADTEVCLSNASCRILVLAPRISQAKSCINRIQTAEGKLQLSEQQSETVSETSEPSESLIKIPWTITNKYYSALVHFAPHRMHGLSSYQLQNVPAIIFVWSDGEAYKHHIERIVQDLDGYEPEVCLAVRLLRQVSSRPQSPASEEEDDAESEGEIDGFLTSRGFEFIDAVEKHATYRSDRSTDIPGMERVLDALSTIMWPSMQPTGKGATKPRTRERILLDWASTSLDADSLSLTAVEDVVPILGEQISNRTRAMKQEMQELARWLEEDVEASRDDPWRTAASSASVSMSPTAPEPSSLAQGTDSETFGFDDNFTVFVSAPAVDAAETSGRSTPDVTPDEQSLSVAPHAGSLYRSLGSVSDFGGSEDGRADEDCAEDLPSKEEILTTSSRIFGLSKHLSVDDSQSAAHSLSIPDENLDASGNLEADGDGEESYDMEPFDLSKVLTTLQEMKAEIANMEDEGERRKAAARVALGLVYGLEADPAEL